jgi:hypothetical protein
MCFPLCFLPPFPPPPHFDLSNFCWLLLPPLPPPRTELDWFNHMLWFWPAELRAFVSCRLGLVSSHFLTSCPPWPCLAVVPPYGFKTGESAHRTPSILGKLYQRRGRGGRRETPSLPPPSLVLLPLDLPSRPSSVYHVAHPSTDFVHSLTLSHTLVLAFRIDPLRSFFTSLVHVLSLTHP